MKQLETKRVEKIAGTKMVAGDERVVRVEIDRVPSFFVLSLFLPS
ncbi:hypothetical protein A2U01_0099952, partial [Trifolium medium]|nr:hypothetical protein [Trifolium medium]